MQTRVNIVACAGDYEASRSLELQPSSFSTNTGQTRPRTSTTPDLELVVSQPRLADSKIRPRTHREYSGYNSDPPCSSNEYMLLLDRSESGSEGSRCAFFLVVRVTE